jgi:hypothetical protein
MQSTDTREQAQPRTLTADEAIARLNTWAEDPGEELTDAVIVAARRWAEAGEQEACAATLRKAIADHDAARVERVMTTTGSLGCAWDADEIRRELRASSMIVEVEGATMAGIMLRARGCHIAYRDSDGQWRGVDSSKREASS